MKYANSQGRDFLDVRNHFDLLVDWMDASGFRPENTPGMWSDLTASVKLGLKDMPLLKDVPFTDMDIRSLLMRGARAAKKSWWQKHVQEKREGKGDTRFALRGMDEGLRKSEEAKLSAMTGALNKIVGDYAAGKIEKGKEIEIGETSDAMKQAGIDDLPVLFNTAVIDKARDKHGLADEEIKQIPDALYNPVMIFESSPDSTNFNNGFVVLTEIKDSEGKPVVIAVNVGKKTRQHIVNDISSIYGKGKNKFSANWVKEWIDDGLLKYSHKKRALAFARSHRLQLPREATLSKLSDNTIIDETDKIKSEAAKKAEKELFGEDGEDFRASISPVWTGSAADYDAPSLQYIGTGEGAQAYGWGLYGSSERGIGESYADNQTLSKNQDQAFLDGKINATSDGSMESMMIKNVLNDVSERKGSISGTLAYYQIMIDEPSTLSLEREYLIENKEWLEKNQNRITYRDAVPLEGNRHLYKQTFWADKKENLLVWNECDIGGGNRERIRMQLEKEGILPEGEWSPDLYRQAMDKYQDLMKRRKENPDSVEKSEFYAAYYKAKKLHIIQNILWGTINNELADGGQVYENLSELLGSPQAASELLYRAGIDGIKYPAASLGSGDGSRGWNYVAFSDKDIRVDEHIRFSISPEADNRYMSAVERGDMETAQRMVDEAAENAGYEKLNSKQAFNYIEFRGYGIPSSIAAKMMDWEIISKSPYSFSFYNSDKITWGYKPEGSLRVSDHWNFESKGERHCVTDVPVENNTHWTMAEYRKGVYHVISSKPAEKSYTEQIRKANAADTAKTYPLLYEKYKYSTTYIMNTETGDLTGKLIEELKNSYRVLLVNGERKDIRKDIKRMRLVSGDNIVSRDYFMKGDSLKIGGVTYDDAGNVIPLSERFNTEKNDIRFSVASKPGYTVERINENSGRELNGAEGVVCDRLNLIFDPKEAPKEGFTAWIRKRIEEYEKAHPFKGEYNTPSLGKKVEITTSSLRSIGSHGGPDVKYNIIPYIPELLENAVLLRTEKADNEKGEHTRSKSHILASKVRYGANRYVAVMVVHESNGRVYYDHSVMIIREDGLGKKMADTENGNPATAGPSSPSATADTEKWNPATAGPASPSAMVLKVAQEDLMSSGFEPSNENNLRFSLSDFDDQTMEDYIAVMIPHVGDVFEDTDSPEHFQKVMKGEGVEVDPETAWAIAAIAIQRKVTARQRRGYERMRRGA